MDHPKTPRSTFRVCSLLAFSFLLIAGNVSAQDPQYSQFYAAPLYLNPAFAGSTNQGRFGVNYRNQWPAIDANFTTFSAFVDLFLEDKSSGVGLLLTRDYVNLVGVQNISMAAQYSYDLSIVKGFSFRPGFEVGVTNRSINFGKLVFGDQLDPNTGTISGPTLETLRGSNRFFPDVSAGGLFYTSFAWLGYSAHHLTTPNISLSGENSSLPIRHSVHGGYKFYLKSGVMGTGLYAKKSERSIAPAVQWRHQGPYDQLDLGTYFTFEPLLVGLWYRGVPYKRVNGYANNESIVMLVGMTLLKGTPERPEVLNIGYSYDYTISQLGPGSGGAHEFSLVYSWPIRNPRKPPKDKMVIPCPDF